MKTFSFITDHTKVHSNLTDLLLTLLAFSFLLSMKVTNVLIIILSINMLIWFVRTPNKQFTFSIVPLLLIMPWLFEILSLIYSDDLAEGFYVVEKKVSLILFPVLFFLRPGFKLANINSFLKILLISVLTVSSYCLIVAIWKYYALGQNTFYWYDFTRPIGGYHPSYFSLVINFLTFWVFLKLVGGHDSVSHIRMILYIAVLIIFGILILLLSSKLHFLIFATILFLGVFCYFKKKNVKWSFRFLVLILIFTVIVIFKGNLVERYYSIAKLSYSLNAPVESFNELTIRFALLECAWEIISKNTFIGVGVGDTMNELDKIYRANDYKFGYLDRQDPHNQFVRILIGTGVIGLFLFLASISTLLSVGMSNGNYLIVGFVLIFSISFLFESVLERHNGIIIYSILSSILIFGDSGMKRGDISKVVNEK